MSNSILEVRLKVSWLDNIDINKEQIKDRLKKIVDFDFKGFNDINFQILSVKKQSLITGEFSVEEILNDDFINGNSTINVQGVEFRANTPSKRRRLKIFKSNQCCSACGLKGTKFIVKDDCIDFYAEENGNLVLMTVDHIKSKMKGGTNDLNNLATSCLICNNLKGSEDLTYAQVKQLRNIYNKKSDGISKEVVKRVIQAKKKNFIKDNKK